MTTRTVVTVRYHVTGVTPDALASACERLAEALHEQVRPGAITDPVLGGTMADGLVVASVTVRGAPPVAVQWGVRAVRHAVQVTAATDGGPLRGAVVTDVRAELVDDPEVPYPREA